MLEPDVCLFLTASSSMFGVRFCAVETCLIEMTHFCSSSLQRKVPHPDVCFQTRKATGSFVALSLSLHHAHQLSLEVHRCFFHINYKRIAEQFRFKMYRWKHSSREMVCQCFATWKVTRVSLFIPELCGAFPFV